MEQDGYFATMDFSDKISLGRVSNLVKPIYRLVLLTKPEMGRLLKNVRRIHMLKIKKAVALVLTMIMLSALIAGCTQPAETAKSDNAAAKPAAADNPAGDAKKPLEGKHLRYAVNATFPPFESVQLVNGKPNYIGMDIELVDYLSKQLGFTYEISDMAFAGLIGAIQSNRADFVCSGISPTAERLKNVDFSISYYYPGIAVVSKKGSALTSLEELKGKKIVVGFGTTYEEWAKKNIEGAEVHAIDGTPAVIQELKNSRGDAGILDANQAAEFVKQNPDLQFNVLDYDRSRENSFAIAFPKNSELTELFNTELNKMLENAEMDKLVVKWCGAEFASKGN